jgi:glucose/arabinose dehydrogenase
VEEGWAAIHEFDLANGTSRIFAFGLRNAVDLAWESRTGALWTVVNERDGLGDETPPDYLTSAQEDGFYGWPYCCWGQTVDGRVPQDSAAVAKALTPDYALGGQVFVPFDDVCPAGPPRDILSGFLAPDEHESYGRPVGVAIGADRRSLLMADDVGNVIWRVTGA